MHRRRASLAIVILALSLVPAKLAAQGASWLPDPQNVTQENLWGISCADGVLLAVGENGTIIRSNYESRIWQALRSGNGVWLLGVAHGNGRWIVVGDNGTIYSSDDDGDSWTARRSGTTKRLNAVAFGNNRWLAVGEGGTVITSATGETWETRPALGTGFFRGLAFGQGRFLFGGGGGALYTTTDATTFTALTSPTTADIEAVAISSGRYFLSGSQGFLASSAGLDAWTVWLIGDEARRAGTFRGLAAPNDIQAAAVGDTTAYSLVYPWAYLVRYPGFLATAATVGVDETVAVGFRGAIARASTLYGATVEPERKSLNVIYGSDARLDAKPLGATTGLAFQWGYNGKDLVGATEATLLLRKADLATAGDYTVRITSAGTSLSSAPLRVNVIPGGRPEVVDRTFSYGYALPPGPVFPTANEKIFINPIAPSSTGFQSPKIVRLNRDGSVDPTFALPNPEPTGSFTIVRALDDGRVVISGSLRDTDGVFRSHAWLLNPDGSIDRASAFGSLLARGVNAAPATNDRFYSGTSLGTITRINADGTTDPSFATITDATGGWAVDGVGRVVTFRTAPYTYTAFGQTYSTRDSVTTVTRYAENGDKEYAVGFSNGGSLRMLGNWLFATTSEYGKIYGTTTPIKFDLTKSTPREGNGPPQWSGASSIATQWYPEATGRVWDLSTHRTSYYSAQYGMAAVPYSPTGRLESDRYATAANLTDFAPLATASDGAIYAVPQRLIAGTSPIPELVRIRPITGRVGRLTNLSVRAPVTPASPLIVGFATTGTDTTRALIRAVGPGLAPLGVDDALRDPTLTVNRDGSMVTRNEDWDSALSPRFAALGAFPLPVGSRDAAVEVDIESGSYTAVLTVGGGDSGSGLVELFESASAATPRRFINVSARGPVAPDRPLIVGFSITGDVPRSVMIRGAGPALRRFGITDALADPTLKLFRQNTALWENDTWRAEDPVITTSGRSYIASVAMNAGAFSFDPVPDPNPNAPKSTLDAAMIVTLAPGSYTAQVSGLGPGATATGTALIEVYEVP